MKLFIKYNCDDINQALKIAQETSEYADVLVIGSLLIFKEGIHAVKAFKKQFPDKRLCIDAKIANKGKETVDMLCQAGAHIVSVLAGTYHSVIQKAAQAAEDNNTMVMLDFINADSIGLSAHEAKTLGVHSILVHRESAPGEALEIASNWQEIKENTDLPIFIKGRITKEIIQEEILPLKPDGIIVGSAIIDAGDPARAAQEIKALLKD